MNPKKQILKKIKPNFKKFDKYKTCKRLECFDCPISNSNTNFIWDDFFSSYYNCDCRISLINGEQPNVKRDNLKCTERIKYFKELCFKSPLMETE